MTSIEFIEKYQDDGYGHYWNRNPSELFWAAAYKAIPDRLLEMSKDFLTIPNLSSSSSLALAKYTVKMGKQPRCVKCANHFISIGPDGLCWRCRHEQDSPFSEFSPIVY